MSLGRALEDLQELTERLRRDCPWDREQTERTIVPHTVEEAYEVADAATVRDDAKLADELGDLLFQVYFLALLLKEKGIKHTTSECTLRGFTCAQANVDPKVATPAEIAKMRAIQTGHQVEGITGGLEVKDQK